MYDLSVKAENKVIVEGILHEIELTEGVSRAGKEYIRGNVTVLVSQKNAGVMEQNEVVFDVFAMKYQKNGQPMVFYNQILELKEKLISVRAAGSIEGASVVRIKDGNLAENTFFTGGIERKSTRVQGSNFRAVTAPNPENQTAVFQITMVLLSMAPEIDSNGEETNRLKVTGAVVVYGEKVDVMEFFIEDPNGIAYFTSNFEEQDTISVGGRIRYGSNVGSSTLTPADEEVAFGEAIVIPTTRYVREFIITTARPKHDEDTSYDVQAIAEGLRARKTRLMEEKARSQQSRSTPAAPATGTAKPDLDF